MAFQVICFVTAETHAPSPGPWQKRGERGGGGGEWGWVSTPKTSLFRKKTKHTHSKQTEKATTTTTTTGQGLKAQAFDSRFPQANEERISELYQIARPQFEFILFYHMLLDQSLLLK